jgi:hypothetical protein
MTIVNIDPAPDSFSFIDVDQTPFTHKQISLRVCGIESFVFIEFFKHARIVGKLENLAGNNGAGFAEHRTRIFPQVIESPMYPSPSDAP